MHTFVRVLETRSFTKAAREGGISPSLASKRVSWLEGRLGAKLLNRSTRSVSLTETGEVYYTQCLKVLAESEVAENIVAELHGEPQGRLRITCPSGLGATILNQAFAQFSLKYPKITLETRLTDEIIDFTEGRIDFALRLAPSLPDSNLLANEITRVKLSICAAPAYLDQYGRPETPEDLKHHNCLRFAHTRTGADIWYLKKDDDTYDVTVSGNYRANNPSFMKEAVVQGVGIAILPSYVYKPDSDAGRIELLLPEFELQPLRLFLIRQHREYMPLRIKLFQQFIKDWARQNIPNCHP
ncbi:LysR family transcriptional regulator [Pseudomonadota bacterium]